MAVFLAASLPSLADMPQWYLDKGLSMVDTDGDGIPDVWEKRTYGNPAVADSHLDRDGDGLTDLEEFWHRTDPRTFSTMGDFWSDSEKVAAGLNPLTRVESAVGIEQWLAYLGWNAQMWSGWTAQAWLALHAPDEHGFGRPYSGFVYNTLPYSEPSRTDTFDFWLKTRTDRLALATVGDRLSTNTFLVLPGERRYRIRMAKDGPVSLTVDPLPGNFADIPGATNGLWICAMSLEPAQSNLVIFPAGSPPSIPAPPSGLECLVVGDAPEEEPPDAPGPQFLGGLYLPGQGDSGPFFPLAGDIRKLNARHKRVTANGDYGGIWCMCGCTGFPTFGSLNISAPGGATLNGQPLDPDMYIFAATGVPDGPDVTAVTNVIGSAEYPFMRWDMIVRFARCQAAGISVWGVEDGDLSVSDPTFHTPCLSEDGMTTSRCMWRGCDCSIGLTTTVGFDHALVNTCDPLERLFDQEPAEDRKYNHCIGIDWQDQPFDLMGLVECFNIDLAAIGCDIRWEVNGKLQESSEIGLGGMPEDLDPTILRVKMIYVFPAGEQAVWDRIILVVNNPATRTLFDAWHNRFSVETNWLAELPAMYDSVMVTTDFWGRFVPTDPEPSATNLWKNSVAEPGEFMHHKAKWEMRSQRTPGGHGHQACYNAGGESF